MIQSADKFLAFHEFSSSRCTLVPFRTNMISKVPSVFDAAVRTVSAALLLSSCLSEFLLPGSLVMSLPGKFMEPFLLGQSIMVVAGYTGYQTETTKLKLCFESRHACQSNILHSRSRKLQRNIKASFCPGSGLVLHLKVSGSKGMEQNRFDV